MTDQKIISRKEAKQQGLKSYFTGKPCKHGHIDKRKTGNGRCMTCNRATNNAYYKANTEKLKAKNKAWYKANPEKVIAKNKAYREANPEKVKAKNKAYYEANPQVLAAINAKRRAAKLQRTPRWLTDQHNAQIKEVYRLAKLFEEEYGVKYHVDHIVPLQGKLVSGLHVPWNLMTITQRHNNSKRNSFEV